MREGMYMVCLEPATTSFGRKTARKSDNNVWLEPGEKRKYFLEFGILDGQDSIKKFQKRLINITA
jgi:hypothetical protein